MPARTLTASALAGLVLAYAAGARGYDVQIDVDTDFQAYEVRSPATAVFWARRRLVDMIGMRYVQPLSKDQGGRLAPRVQVQLNLRLYQEFGETCLVADDVCLDATDSFDLGTFHPLARDSLIDAPLAYVEGTNLPLGLRVRAGRQLYWDRIGFARIDGGSASIDPWPWLRLEAIGGAMVDDTSVAGSSAFVPQGVARLDLSDEQRERAPYIEPPVTTWAAGAGTEVGLVKIARVGASFRELWENHQVVLQRGGLGVLSQPVDPLRLQTDAVWDMVDLALVDAQAAVELRTGELTWRLSGQRHVPRFDRGTIWAYFPAAPIWEEKFGLSWDATDELQLGGALCGRHADLPEGFDHDAGLEGNAALWVGALHLGLSGFGWSGDLGPVWGADLNGSRSVLSWLILQGRVSLWRIEDSLRADLRGASISETVGAKFRVTETTVLNSEISHAYSEVIGNRFWFFAFLHLGAWR